MKDSEITLTLEEVHQLDDFMEYLMYLATNDYDQNRNLEKDMQELSSLHSKIFKTSSAKSECLKMYVFRKLMSMATKLSCIEVEVIKAYKKDPLEFAKNYGGLSNDELYASIIKARAERVGETCKVIFESENCN